jgi:thermopsin
MGISCLGLRNTTGNLTGYWLNTTGIEGTVTLNQAQTFNLDSLGPQYVMLQMNTILTNVMLFNHTTDPNGSSYEYWVQNVVDYLPQYSYLFLVTEIWNSTGGGSYSVTPNSLVSYNGTIYPPITEGGTTWPGTYSVAGPALEVPYPFTLSLFTNTAVVGDRPVLYLNYSVDGQSGNYDALVFNSSGSHAPRTAAPVPYSQISGYYGPGGEINDAEWVLSGPGGGSMSTYQAINGTMQLLVQNETTRAFQSVPSAYDYGMDTGETINGVSEWWSGGQTPTVHLSLGPSFAEPLWNASAHSDPGMERVQAKITPNNAFAWFSPGTVFDSSQAQWAPLLTTATTEWDVSPGTYTVDVMLSDYIQQTVTVSSSTILTVDLTRSLSAGIYTPLIATDDAQLAVLAESGSGTTSSPYIINATATTPLNELFARFSGTFFFPTFPGLLLMDNTACVTIEGASFPVVYPSQYDYYLDYLGLPTTNDMQVQLFNTTNVTLTNSTISGWYADSTYWGEYQMADLMVWGSTNTLVERNNFTGPGPQAYVSESTNTVFFANRFMEGASAPYEVGYPTTIGLVLASNETLTYNNYFSAAVPSQTVPGYGWNFSDTWDVSNQSASSISDVVNGISLSGSIMHLSWQGGNFWANYVSGTTPLPYNDTGLISLGGDYLPLPFTCTLTFTEKGLPTGDLWSISAGNMTSNISAGEGWTIWLPNGTYALSAGASGFSASYPDIITLKGADRSVMITFTPVAGFLVMNLYPVNATLLVNGTQVSPSGSGSFSETLHSGTYPVVAKAPQYTTYFNNVTVVGGKTTWLNFTMTPVPIGHLRGEVSPVNLTLFVGGSKVSLQGGAYALALTPGLYSVVATAPSFLPYFNNVSLPLGQTIWLNITLHALPTPLPTPPSQGGNSSAVPWTWIIVASAAVVVAVILVVLLIRNRKKQVFAKAKASQPHPYDKLASPVEEGTEATNESAGLEKA